MASPKAAYYARDFFQRSEFRGLLLADYQEAIGDSAFEYVNKLNHETVHEFSKIESFCAAMAHNRKIKSYYKGRSALSVGAGKGRRSASQNFIGSASCTYQNTSGRAPYQEHL